MSRAACRGVGVDLFFPKAGAKTRKTIRLYCARCPVIEECATFARETDTHDGVWGGRVLKRVR